MTGFDNPLQTWNVRLAREDFLFGEEPNAFLVSAAAYVVRFAFRPGAGGGT
jgi:hypothetical protein